ncbi:MAG: hypothetical protein LBK53_00690 [Heliobacteriaceae bacterium]|nr:hypothetical protein [Heliobacteriaceae bacterium]
MVKSHHNHPVILNLFQDPALGKSHYLLNFVPASVHLYREKDLTEIVYFYRWTDPETPEVNPVVQDDVTLSIMFLYSMSTRPR